MFKSPEGSLLYWNGSSHWHMGTSTGGWLHGPGADMLLKFRQQFRENSRFIFVYGEATQCNS